MEDIGKKKVESRRAFRSNRVREGSDEETF